MNARIFLLIVPFLSCLSSPSLACVNSWGCATGPVIVGAYPGYGYFDWQAQQRSSYAAVINRPCTIWDGARERIVPCQTLAAIEGGYARVGYAYTATDVAFAPPCVVVDLAAFPAVHYVPIWPGRARAQTSYRRTITERY